MIIFYILLGLILLIIVYLIFAYNRFIALTQRISEAWSDIEVQLKRRYDLIPNLLETVKGYAAHEKQVFENVTKARTMAMGASDVKSHAEAENMLSGALKNLFAVAEAYPNLRASENFAKLHDELTDTENKIQAARRFYNSNVMAMNVAVDSFPPNIIANMFHFSKKDFFELKEEEASQPIKVQF